MHVSVESYQRQGGPRIAIVTPYLGGVGGSERGWKTKMSSGFIANSGLVEHSRGVSELKAYFYNDNLHIYILS